MNEKIDKLDRGEFIEFIEGLILNSEQYKRNNDSSSYVIALDSAWGTGKSYFIDLLIQSGADKTLNFVKYNAWKNDYCENAFDPLIYDILTSNSLSYSMENQADAENTQNMLAHIAKIGLAMGKQFIFNTTKDKLGIDVKEAFNEVKSTDNPFKNFLLRQSPVLAEINSERDSFEKFKQYLEQNTSYLKENNQKLVVVVDELDRCKPTFVIQTLEVVKHLFDINNIVFLFAVDIQQLSHSISSVYGQDFDSAGYLCRFFDYIAKMPEADISQYVLESISNIENLKDFADFSIYNPDYQKPFHEILKNFFKDIYFAFEFSLRDLDTVIQSYKIMVNNFLFNYTDVSAHMIYIFFLSMKYKLPKLFLSIIVNLSSQNTTNNDANYQKLQKYFINNPNITAAIKWINQKNILLDCSFNIPNNKTKSFKITKCLNVNTLKVIFSSADSVYMDPYLLNITNEAISGILFRPDLIKWEKIKDMTYREYLYKQLEMYNFYNVEQNEN